MKKIIIVGAGISGLTAGIFARKAGFEAEIYETHTVAGGMCTGWQRKGYAIDGCIHWLTGSKKGSDLYKIWETCGALGDEIKVVNHKLLSAYRDGNTYRYLHSDLAELEKEFIALSPEDKPLITELVQTVKAYQTLTIPAGKPLEFMSFMEKYRYFLPFIKTGKRLAKANKISIEAYISRFRSPIVRRLLLSAVPAPQLPANALFFTLAAYVSDNAGFPIGGSYAMAQRMKKRFLELGGVLHLGTPVKRIAVRDGKAVGIETEAGTEIFADYVVSAVSADVLLNKLLDNKFKDRYFEKRFADLKSYNLLAVTVAMFGVNADMQKYPHNLQIDTKSPIMLNNTIINNFAVMHYGYDPTFSVDGKSLVEVLITDSEFEYWRDLKAKSAEDYKKAKEKLAVEILAEIETVYPDLKGKIELIDVVTPLTFNRYCASYRGSYMGFVLTPGVSYKRHKGTIEGVENLYLAGQWVFPNGGLPMATIAGKFAVQRICRKEKISVD